MFAIIFCVDVSFLIDDKVAQISLTRKGRKMPPGFNNGPILGAGARQAFQQTVS
jgi:hypothetical protein